MVLLEKCRFWGDWDVEFDILLSDIMAVPAIVDNDKLVFKVKRVRKLDSCSICMT